MRLVICLFLLLLCRLLKIDQSARLIALLLARMGALLGVLVFLDGVELSVVRLVAVPTADAVTSCAKRLATSIIDLFFRADSRARSTSLEALVDVVPSIAACAEAQVIVEATLAARASTTATLARQVEDAFVPHEALPDALRSLSRVKLLLLLGELLCRAEASLPIGIGRDAGALSGGRRGRLRRDLLADLAVRA